MASKWTVSVNDIKIAVVSKQNLPSKIDAIVYQQDTFLLSAENEIPEEMENAGRNVQRLVAQSQGISPVKPGSVLIKDKYPYKFWAVIYDFNLEPPFGKKRWIQTALEGIVQHVDQLNLQAIALPVLGKKYGTCTHEQFFRLLLSAIQQRNLPYLERVSIIAPDSSSCRKHFEVLSSIHSTIVQETENSTDLDNAYQ